MKRLMIGLALAALVAGCGKKTEEREDVRFGYRKGDGDYDSYFTVPSDSGTLITNHLTGRLLGVLHDYEYSADELRLLKDAGTVTPGAALKEIPAGYRKRLVEPWYTTWESDAERLGEKGMAGCIAHFDPDENEHQVIESFYSSYWKTAEEALAAQKRLRERIARTYHPKKFWEWPQSRVWIAEYVRLRVIVIVGPIPDGKKWACMLSLYDKCNHEWENYADVKQQEWLLKDWQYGKDYQVWSAARHKIVSAKHAAVLKLCAERGYRVAENERWGDSGSDMSYYLNDGGTVDTNRTTVADFVAEKTAALAARYGVTLPELAMAKGSDDPFTERRVAKATNDLYKVLFEVTVFKPQPPSPPDPEMERREAQSDGVKRPEPPPPPPVPAPTWELRVEELPYGDFVVPPAPEYPQPPE